MKKNIFLLKRHLLGFVVTLILLVPVASFAASPMPSFSLEGVSEKEIVTSASLEGQVVLISFFATWCPPCVQEVPGFIRLTNDLADKGFTLLAISADQGDIKVVNTFIEKHNINYKVAMANREVMQDFGGVYGIPVSFLVNRKGDVVKRYTGFVPHSLLEKDINRLL